MSRTILITGEPARRYDGPPADRMAGRPSRATVKAAKKGGNFTAKTTLTADQAIDQAIHQGVIGANMAAHYKVLWQADPDETREYLEKMGLYPYPLASGPEGNPEMKPPEKIAAAAEDYPTTGLSRAELGRMAAAREGRTSRVISGGL